jgi:hypothetical protein
MKKYLVLVRWSEVEQTYQYDSTHDDQESADERAQELRDEGAVNARVEVREFPAKEEKGGKQKGGDK